MEQGNTKVLATVYGPRQASAKDGNDEDLIINCQYSAATFSTGERKHRPGADMKTQEMTIHLQNALVAAIKTELYPKSEINIFVEVIQSDGGNYCTAVNAATLALIDAGIAISEYICACSSSIANGDTPLIDVSNLEEITGGPVLTVAALPNSEKIAFMEMSQRFHLEELPHVLRAVMNGCKEVKNIMDKAVHEHLKEIGAASEWYSLRMK